MESRGCKTEKMHGNLFQQGVPDLLILFPDKTFGFIETKWTMAYSVTRKEVHSMLRPMQKSFMKKFKASQTFICVGGPRGIILLMADQLEVSDEKLEWESMEEVIGSLC